MKTSTTPVYLSADTPRWTPKTEADLQTVIDEGLLQETQYLDAKQAPSSNKETARDLASFAIDSGTLIIGIAEDKTSRTFALAPQPLKGLPEKIEQIARSIPDPPLNVVTQEISSAADPTRGYLIVHIPASPTAPHMVDGRYYGRGDKTKYALKDPEVVRLHEGRRAADQDALALLQYEIDNDPIPADQRKQAHLFLVAQPLAGRPDMLLEMTSGPRWNINLADFIQEAFASEADAALNGGDVPPSLHDASTGFRRGGGVSRATQNLGSGRTFTPTSKYSPEDAIELQVNEDGGLRLFFSRFSTARHDGISEEQLIIDRAAVVHTRRFLALVLAAAERAGYLGNWALAFGATGVKGLRAAPSQQVFWEGDHYNQDTYSAATSVTWAELGQARGAVTRRLIGSLLRTLGTESYHDTILIDPENDPEAVET